MNWIQQQLSANRAFFRANIAKRSIICLVVFLLLSVVFYQGFRAAPEQAQKIYDQFAQMVKESGIGDEGYISAVGLLKNNARSAAISLGMGILPFLFLPALPLLANAVIIGGVLALVAGNGVSIGRMVLFGLVPHGIFEIPALMISIAAGLWLCRNMCRMILKRPSAAPLEELLPCLLRLFLLTVLPLLVIAALIEGYITPLLIQQFVS